jgi:hypothetical protein
MPFLYCLDHPEKLVKLKVLCKTLHSRIISAPFLQPLVPSRMTDWIILDVSNALKSDAQLGPVSHTCTVKQAFLNKRVQSHLKVVRALNVKTLEVLVLICCVPQLWKTDARNLKDYPSYMAKFKHEMERRRETTKPLQFLPLWSSGQSSWLLTQRSHVRFPALPGFLSTNGSGTGSTQPLWG